MGDVTQLQVLAGLDAKQHLAGELLQRSRQTGAEFAAELRQLGPTGGNGFCYRAFIEFSRRFGVLAAALPQAGFQLPVVCILDEVERILPFPADSPMKAAEFNAVFGTLRSISQTEQKLAILVADVHPDCTRVNTWPQAGLPSNPVYAFFKELFLQPFSEDDTKTMIRTSGS
jgi:hypothetical protein